MECSCNFSATADGYSAILSDKVRTARKTHRCRECNRPIQPGEKYRVEKTLFDGSVGTVKTCMDCNSIRTHLCEYYYYGEVRELVRNSVADMGGEVPERCISPLTPIAREWVCGLIEEEWEEIAE